VDRQHNHKPDRRRRSGKPFASSGQLVRGCPGIAATTYELLHIDAEAVTT
jgi:hypothetical protein